MDLANARVEPVAKNGFPLVGIFNLSLILVNLLIVYLGNRISFSSWGNFRPAVSLGRSFAKGGPRSY
jgi:hypothetical protein